MSMLQWEEGTKGMKSSCNTEIKTHDGRCSVTAMGYGASLIFTI